MTALTEVSSTKVYPHGLREADASADLIKNIEWFRIRPRWLFVRVETESGIVGWGGESFRPKRTCRALADSSFSPVRSSSTAEATLEGHSEAVEGSLSELRERFIGWNSADIEDIYQTAYRLRFYRGGEVLMSAISGIDMCLWDIKGKKLGVPVWELLGGKV